MEIATDGMFLTKERQKLFDSWTKEQIYEAYLVEHEARLALNKENIKLNQSIFNKSHEIKELKEKISMHSYDVLAWADIKPKIYYKNGEPFGLLATREGENGLLYIASMVGDIDDNFTKDMIKDIIMLYNKRTICLITDVESKQKLIRRALSRYNFTYEIIDGIMYSTGGRSWQ